MKFTLHQHAQMVTALDPESYPAAAATVTGATEIDTHGFDEIAFVVVTGALGASGTVDIQIQESATSGSGYTDITGAALTTLTQAGGDSDQHAIIRINLRNSSRKRYLIVERDLNTAASIICVVAFLFSGAETPVDNSAAIQVVSVD